MDNSINQKSRAWYNSHYAQTNLSSERIEIKYGNYGIHILQNETKIRVTQLFTTQDRSRITRTFAVVFYPEHIDPSFAREHSRIKSGESLGFVFKEQGWKIEKKNLFFGEIRPSKEYRKVYAEMGDIPARELAVHVYEFDICKAGKELRYATIAEVYHPDFLTLDDLMQIYEGEFVRHTQESEEIAKTLAIVADKMQMH